jgi:hypothetical protein
MAFFIAFQVLSPIFPALVTQIYFSIKKPAYKKDEL